MRDMIQLLEYDLVINSEKHDLSKSLCGVQATRLRRICSETQWVHRAGALPVPETSSTHTPPAAGIKTESMHIL